MAETQARSRPLSPHLQIWRWTLTMALSILHRATGVALYAGTLLVAWWLWAAASGPQAYAMVEWFMGTIIGRIVLFGYTWSLIHHMLGGIRHLIWDMEYGFGPAEREWLAMANVVGAIVLTFIVWVVGYLVMGGPR
jgi:succinate dehydrogenase / fumarate reductase cytochrome b subunit